MTELYLVMGVSKQAMYKFRKRELYIQEQETLVIASLVKVRKDHKKMGSRKIYISQKEKYKISIGRDHYEQIAFCNGFRVRYKRHVYKTTWGQNVVVYPDLVSGLTINNIDQVFQTDIFYFKVEQIDFYGVTIIDVYSKRLLALHMSKSLKSIENIRAFRQVLKIKPKKHLIGCILHSDKGSQNISKALRELVVNGCKMKLSMCKMPQQNAYVERIHGTLKHEYLEEILITEKNITRAAAKIKRLYNDERPHQSLKNITPIAFEEKIKTMNSSERPQVKIYQWEIK
jgi:putative transposase